MKRAATFFFLLLLFAAAFLAAAELRIADATAAGDIPVRQLALKLALAGDSVPISYARRNVREALADLAAGKVELAVVDVPDIPKEFPGTRKVYAVRALVFYVNVANTLESATSDQLRNIFTLPDPKWDAYSFLSTPVVRYGVKTGRPGAEQMADFLIRGSKLAEKTRLLASSAEVLLMVGADASGIGFGVFIPGAPVQVRMLAVDGVEPTLKSVAETAYPLAVKRAVLTSANPGEAAAKFLAEMDKADFRDLVLEAGMQPVEK